nr:hypothetical protein Iba_scaffold22921CG0010 [Ipomoea batatas]
MCNICCRIIRFINNKLIRNSSCNIFASNDSLTGRSSRNRSLSCCRREKHRSCSAALPSELRCSPALRVSELQTSEKVTPDLRIFPRRRPDLRIYREGAGRPWSQTRLEVSGSPHLLLSGVFLPRRRDLGVFLPRRRVESFSLVPLRHVLHLHFLPRRGDSGVFLPRRGDAGVLSFSLVHLRDVLHLLFLPRRRVFLPYRGDSGIFLPPHRVLSFPLVHLRVVLHLHLLSLSGIAASLSRITASFCTGSQPATLSAYPKLTQ